jgi:hypothetical protein
VTRAARVGCAAIAAVITALGAPGLARAARPQYSISIGYNGLPPSAPEGLKPLRFADDDAASFHQFASALSRRSYLLALLDADTQARFPGLTATARPPTLVELRRTVAEVAARMEKDVARGDHPSVLIFYSGHGMRGGGQAGLSFLDGALTRDALYAEVLPAFRDRSVHLFIDACHAEAIVRPRDLQAAVVDASDADVSSYLQDATLARFPEVGAVMASTMGRQSHEWDVYQSGVFTHEILSALRGGADVDGNGRIEYSELAAFLAAANREVADPRARPQSVVHAPSLDPRAPIVSLGDFRDASFLEGRPGFLGSFFIEDARGNRLVDLRAERDFPVRLVVPAGEVLYVRNDRREASLTPAAGGRVRFEDLDLADASTRARGSLDGAFRHGLFATSFGPDYYRGFVDRPGDLVPVSLPDVDLSARAADKAQRPERSRKAAIATSVFAGSLLLGAGVAGAFAWSAHKDFDNTTYERTAFEAKNRYELNLGISLGLLGGALVVGSIAALLFARSRGSAAD